MDYVNVLLEVKKKLSEIERLVTKLENENFMLRNNLYEQRDTIKRLSEHYKLCKWHEDGHCLLNYKFPCDCNNNFYECDLLK